MPLPQHLTLNYGGPLSLDLSYRPVNAVAMVLAGDGTTIVGNVTATVDSINSNTLSALVAGNVAIGVSNGQQFSPGVEFWVRTPDEKARCKTVSGNIVSLWQPLLYGHASGVAVEGSQVKYVVPAANCIQRFWDGRVKWTVDANAVFYTAAECTDYPLQRIATVQDLFTEHPLFHHLIDGYEDAERLLDAAHEDVLVRIGGKMRTRVFTGSREFVRATVYCALANHYRRQQSDEATTLFERYAELLQEELQRIVETTPRDEDMDGVVSQPEKKSARSIPLWRR